MKSPHLSALGLRRALVAGSRRVVAQRTRSYFRTPAEAAPSMGSAQFTNAMHGVSTGFFEVHGRLRLENHWVDEHSLVKRDGGELTIIWRDRGAGATVFAGKP